MLLMTIMLLSGMTRAQEATSLKKMNIGDQVPEFVLTSLINYPMPEMKLSDFKGKLLILDFWNTGCTSCIESWPKLLKLQKQFKDKIQMVLVNYLQDEKAIQPLLKKWERIFGQKMTLPIACNDKRMYEFFPHQGVPHVVWIDANGRVKHITDGLHLNEEKIQKILDGETTTIYEKTAGHMDEVKFHKPLFLNGNGGSGDQMVYSCVISKYVPGIGPTTQYYNKKDYALGVLTNASLIRMFRDLFGRGIDKYGAPLLLPYARIILKTADTAAIVSFVNGNFRYENLYSIQTLSRQKASEAKIKQRMISNLEQYFQVKTSWAKQKMKSLVVSRSSSPITAYTEGERLLNANNSQLAFNKITVQEFLDKLLSNTKYWYEFPYPVVDETNFEGYLGKVSFETDFSNYRLMGKELEKHGLKFSLEDREVDVLVINDDK